MQNAEHQRQEQYRHMQIKESQGKFTRNWCGDCALGARLFRLASFPSAKGPRGVLVRALRFIFPAN